MLAHVLGGASVALRCTRLDKSIDVLSELFGVLKIKEVLYYRNCVSSTREVPGNTFEKNLDVVVVDGRHGPLQCFLVDVLLQ